MHRTVIISNGSYSSDMRRAETSTKASLTRVVTRDVNSRVQLKTIATRFIRVSCVCVDRSREWLVLGHVAEYVTRKFRGDRETPPCIGQPVVI